ncbi:MAG: flavin reductase family protein [Longicatena sp.]
MNTWKEIPAEELHSDPFTLIGKEWMLVSAQKDGVVNTMTASWGGVGILWNKKVAFIFIRPQRYTKEFIEASESLTLSFYDEVYRKQLSYLGSVSGKDEDKIAHVDFHVNCDRNAPYFEEANTVMIAHKLYQQDLQEDCFIQKDLITKNYPNKDYHTLYVVEIDQVLVKEAI